MPSSELSPLSDGSLRTISTSSSASLVTSAFFGLRAERGTGRRERYRGLVPKYAVSALEALGELKATIPQASVVSLLKDASPHVRAHALDYVQENPSVPLIPTLKKLLDDPVGDVRENAVEALAAYRDPAARLALRGALTSEDPKVRRRAAEALGERK